MKYLKEVFKFYDVRYFVQSYAVSIFIAFLYILGRDGGNALISMKSLTELVVILACTILYPFAKASYLYIKELLLPNDVAFIAPLIMIYVAKISMAMILYVFAIPLGLINIAIIVVKYRKVKKVKEEIQWFE